MIRSVRKILPDANSEARAARLRVGFFLLIATAFLIGALALLPRAIESAMLLAIEDDPVSLADRALDRSFDSNAATREIEQALTNKDPDLAKSFVELAQERNIAIASDLAEKVEVANTVANSPASHAEGFARGLISGEPDDLVSLAGTALGDIFVFGDIRDAVREGARLAAGQPADRLILGLSCVGIAITAGTYVTLGAGAPARVGLSVVKAARKTGRLGERMGEWIARSLRGVVDWSSLRKALAGASLTEPALAVRAAREAVKIEKAEDLFRLTRDVSRVQTKAGTQAALDGLKLADNPRQMSRVAKLAEAKGGKTRAILKFLGRGAIALTAAILDLALWLFGAALMVLGFVSSIKAAVERATMRHIRRRKVKLAKKRDLAMTAPRA
ncbi:MAG: hypothetical protein HY659_01405 [Rhizobiales bacterium]|nr:hypothetical protein [Hyphomicrobiales bacterium]